MTSACRISLSLACRTGGLVGAESDTRYKNAPRSANHVTATCYMLCIRPFCIRIIRLQADVYTQTTVNQLSSSISCSGLTNNIIGFQRTSKKKRKSKGIKIDFFNQPVSKLIEVQEYKNSLKITAFITHLDVTCLLGPLILHNLTSK